MFGTSNEVSIPKLSMALLAAVILAVPVHAADRGKKGGGLGVGVGVSVGGVKAGVGANVGGSRGLASAGVGASLGGKKVPVVHAQVWRPALSGVGAVRFSQIAQKKTSRTK